MKKVNRVRKPKKLFVRGLIADVEKDNMVDVRKLAAWLLKAAAWLEQQEGK